MFLRFILSSSRPSCRIFAKSFWNNSRSLINTMCDVATSAEKFERLPELAKPTHYTLTLAPDLESFTFFGKEETEIDILKETNYLKLHASELEVNNVSLALADGKKLHNLEVLYDKKWTTITVNLPTAVTPQKAKLSLNFTGELNDKMRGFYRSTYKNSEDKDEYLASTQFESTYARLAFPCWDEPIYKAKFDVTLVVDEGLTALSNMNAIEKVEAGGKMMVTFATTPLMSTYLVALVVGKLEYLEGKTSRDVKVRVYTVPGKENQGSFALELGTKALDWYSEWFGIPYPLPKCDLIAIPDFSMGAMENWGLVTFREVALLVDPLKSSTRQKSRVALVIAHELAHLWFGDLVTMKWWTDLWLKEGFASFMEYLFVGKNYPEFKIWLHFVNDELAVGFGLDALRSSHPIEVEIDNPNELDEIYDNITYAKSNSINRMLCGYLGEDIFRKGLQLYLKKFQYGNAVTNDLWNALSEASGQDIKTLMSTWTKQMGFPLICVSQKFEGKKRILILQQTRFIADGSVDKKKSLWQVPITISTNAHRNDAKYRLLMTKEEEEFTVDNVDSTEWLKLNVGSTGFYRVSYAADMFKDLLPAFAAKTLPVLDRFGIANDLFALVQAGRQPAVQFLTLLTSSCCEDDYTVWNTLDVGISCLANVLSHYDEEVRAAYDKFIIKMLTPLRDVLGWDAAPNEDSQRGLLRALILGRLGRSGDKKTIEASRQLFLKHVHSNLNLHPDLRLAIYGITGRNFDEQGYNELREIYETVGFGEVERNCLTAMSQTPSVKVLEKMFKYGVEDGKVRSQDVIYLFVGAASNHKGQDFIWDYFKKHTKLLLEKFGGANSSLFQHCFKASTDSQCSNKFAEDVEGFVCTSLDSDAARTLRRTTQQITESVRLNEQILERNAEEIKQFLIKERFLVV